ncbi:MAG: diaminopimelate epimerase [Chlorobi bacterium]|nr:diaminopimelate epimerase [Chlorobiota bacterium]
MISFSYQKLSGAGNTFIVVEGKDIPQGTDLPSLTQASCSNEHEHGGADGLIVLDHSDTHDFAMHYYNRDGSTGMMCGNGGRCAVQFAVAHGYTSSTTSIMFINAGVVYSAEMTGKNVRISFPDPPKIQLHLNLNILGTQRICHYADVGTPHLILFKDVLEVDALADLEMKRWGPAVRNHPLVRPEGANANFIEVLPEEKGIRLRTFERGVEGETGACGTGAIASGIASSLLHGWSSPVNVIPTSGSLLQVHFDRDEEGALHNLGLEGGAEVLMEGKLSLATLPFVQS